MEDLIYKHIGKPCSKDDRHVKKNVCAMKESVALDGKHKPSGNKRVRKMFFEQFSFGLWHFGRQTCRDVSYFYLQICNYCRHFVWTDVLVMRPELARNISVVTDVSPSEISLKYIFYSCAYLCVKLRRLCALRNEFLVNFRLCCPIGKTSVLLLTTPFLQVMN